MSDKFDPYREALVVETDTVWPPGCEDLSSADKQRIATALHAAPDRCSQLEYVRQHTGFCRRITVTPADLQRLKQAQDGSGQ